MSTSYTQHLYAGYSLLQVFYSIVFCNFCHHLVMYYISFEIFCQLLLTLFFHSSLHLADHYIRMVLSSYLHLELHRRHHIHSFGLHFRYCRLTLWYFQYYYIHNALLFRWAFLYLSDFLFYHIYSKLLCLCCLLLSLSDRLHSMYSGLFLHLDMLL